MLLREATPEERRLYYFEEWKASYLPDYMTKSLTMREFAFDYNGEGPKDRYRNFVTLTQFEGHMVSSQPYAAYSSVAFYREPQKRSGWLSAELVFDIDAKDLPVRSCKCRKGDVCEVCMEEAKEFVLSISDTLRDIFSLKDIKFVYSGRGYHIRVFDEEVLTLSSQERAELLDYVAGNVVPERENLKGRYPELFIKKAIKILPLFTADVRKEFDQPTIRVHRLLKYLPDVLEDLENDSFRKLREILSNKTYLSLLETIREVNAGMVDARVTVDVKRILRIPGSLHSKVSMICTPVKNLESFDPFRDAVPKFVMER